MNIKNISQAVFEAAIHSGQELGWRVEQFPDVLKKAAAENLACIGGQFQWKFADGTCEAYWLNADPSPRESDESWLEFVARCEQQVLEGFSRLVSTIDFDVEADRFEFLKLKKRQGVSIANHLIFVAYFSNEEGHIT